MKYKGEPGARTHGEMRELTCHCTRDVILSYTVMVQGEELDEKCSHFIIETKMTR